jgi:hypothetical protein
MRILLAAILALVATSPGFAQGSLAVVPDADWPSLRKHCSRLMANMKEIGQPLPDDTLRALRPLLEEEQPDPQAAVRAVQKLLDGRCLLGVSINPESRVKAARGPLKPDLRQGETRAVLVKVHNEAGVTHPLALRGLGLLRKGTTEGGWLSARIADTRPFTPKLNGQLLEYRVLLLTPQEAGKREATFQFDVGQGTQDLGFRAEVPVLFAVRGR